MQVIIFAAELQGRFIEFGSRNIDISYESGVLFVESQIRQMTISGVKPNKITIVLPDVENNALLEKEKKNIGLNVCKVNVSEKSNSFDVLKGYLSLIDGQKIEDLLILHSDVVLTPEVIDKLIVSRKYTTVYVSSVNSIKDRRLRFDVNSMRIHYPNDLGSSLLPVYSGSIYMCASDVEYLSNILFKDYSNYGELSGYINDADAVTKLLDSSNISAVDIGASDSGVSSAIKKSTELKGGSFAGLNKRTLVRKSARGYGVAKLRNEIRWLQQIPEDLKEYFISVITAYESPDYVWYEMPWYDSVSLRRLFIGGTVTIDYVCDLIKDLLTVFKKYLYTSGINNQDKSWVRDRHIKRVMGRLSELYFYDNVFKPIISAEYVVINGKRYNNLPFYMGLLMDDKNLLNHCEPKKIVSIHGDLHLQNILVTNVFNKKFVLADPRGELKGGDFFYDIGKLFHSVHGKYDLIHTDLYHIQSDKFDLNGGWNFDFNFHYQNLVLQYDDLHEKLQSAIECSLGDLLPNNWRLIAYFNELMHFASVMPFHLYDKKNPDRAKVLYATAVVLFEKFMSEYGCQSNTEVIREYSESLNRLEEFRNNKDMLYG